MIFVLQFICIPFFHSEFSFSRHTNSLRGATITNDYRKKRSSVKG